MLGHILTILRKNKDVMMVCTIFIGLHLYEYYYHDEMYVLQWKPLWRDFLILRAKFINFLVK